MTKWFDTNYHYLVPRDRASAFHLARNTFVEQFKEAGQLGYAARPMILGPLSLLLPSKSTYASDSLNLLDRPPCRVRGVALAAFWSRANWVQIDEPDLVLDLNRETIQREPPRCYERLTASTPGIRILFATGFGSLQETLDVALRLPVGGPHLDLVPWKRSVRERLFELRRRR